MLFDHSRGAAEVTAGKKRPSWVSSKEMFDQERGSDKKGVSPHLLLRRGRREENRDFAPKRFFERKGGDVCWRQIQAAAADSFHLKEECLRT